MSHLKPPLSPSLSTPEYSESPPLSPSSTSSANPPFVESLPSSPDHEHASDECPANNEPSSSHILPMPLLNIQPNPKELDECPYGDDILYGFPIPREWFAHRYRCGKAAGLEFGSYRDECGEAMQLLTEICKALCVEMWPEGFMAVGGAEVSCLRDGKPEACMLLRIGSYWDTPPPDFMLEIADMAEEYGIFEMPNWYSVCPEFNNVTELEIYGTPESFQP